MVPKNSLAPMSVKLTELHNTLGLYLVSQERSFNSADLASLFQQRIASVAKQRSALQREMTRVQYLRFASFSLAVISVFFFRHQSIMFAVSGGLLLVFVALVFKHSTIRQEIKKLTLLETINQNSLARLDGTWHNFEDKGDEFIDPDHRYSADLDIFGQNSFFQYLNAAQSVSGRAELALGLTTGIERTVRLECQEAVQELSQKLDWRQNFQVACHGLGPKSERLDSLYTWAEGTRDPVTFPLHKVLLFLPLVTFLCFFLTFFSITFLFVALALLFVQLIIFVAQSKKTIREIKLFEDQHDNLKLYTQALAHIERCEVNTRYLNVDKTNDEISLQKPSLHLKKLSNIVAWCDIKYSPIFYFIANVFLLIDLQLITRLHLWHEQHAGNVKNWILTIARYEYVASFAQLTFENPNWTFPVFVEEMDGGEEKFNATGLAHPLVDAENRVANNFRILPGEGVVLITGSNMSGKSTWLRTVGSNVVLANAGGPVCAEHIVLDEISLFSSMRSVDSLGNSVSTFFHELSKIRKIFEPVPDNSTQLILIDEIFSGTNSKDRYIGAVSLIDALINASRISIISTHDLALSELESLYTGKIRNLHFSEYIDENGMSFDYKLKNGVVSSSNALYLMRLVGIEITDKAIAMFEN